ncbi:MAG: hypothetical protein EPO09_21155 [Aquabacterium sp.]|nr:MAG: hypothetical protein EPO09_21155 [Aquabacterium sp.]
MFTDQIMLGYINDFYMLEMGQEIRINERMTWWEFDFGPTSSNPFPVDLQNPAQAPAGVQFTTIGPLIYVDGFQSWWYQDPEQFFWQWPETQTYTPQRPQYVLYYNQSLLFRGPPDKVYRIKISAYQVEQEMIGGQNINQDYLWRYVCYGAARDIFADYGELDQWANYEPAFRRYKALVYARTYQQNMNQRSLPRF